MAVYDLARRAWMALGFSEDGSDSMEYFVRTCGSPYFHTLKLSDLWLVYRLATAVARGTKKLAFTPDGKLTFSDIK